MKMPFKIGSLADIINTDQRIESVGLFLASFAGTEGIAGTLFVALKLRCF
jgi:hypothetical protein